MEKKNYKKIMFTSEEGNLIISSCIICFANGKKYFDEILTSFAANTQKMKERMPCT